MVYREGLRGELPAATAALAGEVRFLAVKQVSPHSIGSGYGTCLHSVAAAARGPLVLDTVCGPRLSLSVRSPL